MPIWTHYTKIIQPYGTNQSKFERIGYDEFYKKKFVKSKPSHLHANVYAWDGSMI